MSTSPKSPGSFRSAMSVFAIIPFRKVWFGALSGNSGRFAVILVAGWEAYRLGGDSAIWPSLVSFFLLTPTMVFGLIAGTYADRMNRAKVAAVGQTINAAVCFVAAIFAFTHSMSLGIVLATAAVVGIGNSIQGPAWQALIPNLVGQDKIVDGALATRIAQQGSELIGPAIGTLVLTTTGPGWTFMLCSAFYLGGMLLLLSVRGHARPIIDKNTFAKRTPVRRQVVEGLSYVKNTSPIGLLFVWVTCHCSLTMATFGILPTIASVNFHGSAGVYGVLLTTFGLGSVVGPLVLLWFRKLPPGWVLWVTGILSGAPLVVIGFTHSELLAGLMSMLAGAGQAVFMSMIYGSVMSCSANTMRGRVSSVQLSATTGAMGLASLGWGALVSVASAGLVLAAPGAVFVAICFGLIGRVGSVNRSVASQTEVIRVDNVRRSEAEGTDTDR